MRSHLPVWLTIIGTERSNDSDDQERADSGPNLHLRFLLLLFSVRFEEVSVTRKLEVQI